MKCDQKRGKKERKKNQSQFFFLFSPKFNIKWSLNLNGTQTSFAPSGLRLKPQKFLISRFSIDFFRWAASEVWWLIFPTYFVLDFCIRSLYFESEWLYRLQTKWNNAWFMKRKTSRKTWLKFNFANIIFILKKHMFKYVLFYLNFVQ